jgi:hypothetical protein
VRDADEETCRAWADRAEIPARACGRPVLLLGESVARGYFFDPAFTPAQMLEAMLAPHVDGPVEVVDLAGNDLQPGGLLQLLGTAPARLHADAVVIFAGNNWYPGKMLQAVSPAERAAASATLADEGAPGLARYLTGDFREEAARALGAVRPGSTPGSPLLAAAQFNLGEWAAEDVGTPAVAASVRGGRPPLVGSSRRRRGGSRPATSSPRRRRRGVSSSLDERSVPRTLGLLAACRERAGQPDEARELLEQARDARAWAHTTPRCRRVTKEAVRACAAPPLEVIDLADVFAMRLGHPIPSRDLFLDYCHLSADGLRLAMATAARAVILGIGRGNPDLDEILDVNAGPTREVEAAASFCAAIHNAHWGMAGEVVRRHLRRALDLDRRMAETCERFLALQGARDLQDLAMGLEALPGAAPVLSRYLEALRGRTLRRGAARRDGAALEEICATAARCCWARGATQIPARRRADLQSEFYAPRFRHPSWSDETWLRSPRSRPSLLRRTRRPVAGDHLSRRVRQRSRRDGAGAGERAGRREHPGGAALALEPPARSCRAAARGGHESPDDRVADRRRGNRTRRRRRSARARRPRAGAGPGADPQPELMTARSAALLARSEQETHQRRRASATARPWIDARHVSHSGA